LEAVLVPPPDQTAAARVESPLAIALIVEDEALLRWQMADELRDAGWHVLQAGSEQQALLFLHARQEIELLITDIHLGGALNGWDVAEAYRRAWPTIPVVYASANPIEGARVVPDGVFLSKPFGMNELLEICSQLAKR
jgi:DNA-binding response OmpR family regulator